MTERQQDALRANVTKAIGECNFSALALCGEDPDVRTALKDAERHLTAILELVEGKR